MSMHGMKCAGDDGYSMRPEKPWAPPPVRSAVDVDWRDAGGMLGRLNPEATAARLAREREALCPHWMAL